jgi:hypothetical protein
VGVEEFDTPGRDDAGRRRPGRVGERAGGQLLGGRIVGFKAGKVEEHHASRRDHCFTATVEQTSIDRRRLLG